MRRRWNWTDLSSVLFFLSFYLLLFRSTRRIRIFFAVVILNIFFFTNVCFINEKFSLSCNALRYIAFREIFTLFPYAIMLHLTRGELGHKAGKGLTNLIVRSNGCFSIDFKLLKTILSSNPLLVNKLIKLRIWINIK